MNDVLIVSLKNPSADKAIFLLLAAYVTLKVEYPTKYHQFLRALERLVTGKQQPSIHGKSQVKYDRFVSLLNNKYEKKAVAK